MKRLLACLLAMLLLTGALALAEENPTLVVTGSGTVSVPPDRAVITFGVRMSSSDIARAQTYVNENLGKAIERLHKLGVDDKDIQTNVIRIEEDYSYADPILDTGRAYVVENSVSVILSDVDSVGSTIDAVFDAGVNTFTNLQFIATDTSEAENQALTLAVESAGARAEVLAKAAGMKLGALRKIGEASDYYGNGGRFYAKAEGAADSFAGQVYTRDVDVTAAVTMEYELIPMD